MSWWLKKKHLSLVTTLVVFLVAFLSIIVSDSTSLESDSARSSPQTTPESILGITQVALPATTPSGATSSAQVVKIIDGDTIRLSTGQTVRYIGIDTPETKNPRREVECFGQEATQKNTELVLNKTVVLEKDVSNTDRYGRLLRYVYVDGLLINQALVAEGYATATQFPPDIKYAAQLQAAEMAARQANRGLWSDVCHSPKPKS